MVNGQEIVKIWGNEKYLDYVVRAQGLTWESIPAPTPGVPAHRRELKDSKPLEDPNEIEKYRSCVGALVYYGVDRGGGQLEVSLLGGAMKTPSEVSAKMPIAHIGLGPLDNI